MTKDMIDLVYQAIFSGKNIEEYLGGPQKHKNTRGIDLFGYSPENIAKAALYYSAYSNEFMFEKAKETLSQMHVSIAIEELVLTFREALFKNIDKVDFLHKSMSLDDMVLELYSRFSEKPKEVLQDLLNRRSEIYLGLWADIVTDEDNVKLEHLNEFYGSIPFPVSCFFINCAAKSLETAYRALPILLAKSNNCKRIFDFGGNSGIITSAIANTLNVGFCMLIEESDILLEFAKWRDELFGIKNVFYQKESFISENIREFSGQFDMGICTEVLEHVFDVEETVSNIAKLLQPGGILYQTTSFGLYPEASHLKKNVRYAGKEDELMRKFGFEKANVQFPIPLLSTLKVYIKK